MCVRVFRNGMIKMLTLTKKNIYNKLLLLREIRGGFERVSIEVVK